MIKHSFAPCKYGISTIVAIHKGSNIKAAKCKNYRAVALSSVFSIICILIMLSDSLLPDPLQVHLLFVRWLITILIMTVVFTCVCWMHQNHLTV